MSSNKYADLPDIDTAPDVYETLDAFQSAHDTSDEDSDEDIAPRVRTDTSSRDELDSSSLIEHAEARRRFLKAERKHRQRTYYTYPPDDDSPSGPPHTRPVSLSARLRSLQTELAALEAELADPSNPQLAKEREADNVDPGELIRGLVDVRGRLNKIRKGKEGRARLVGAVLGDDHRGREEEQAASPGKDAAATSDEGKRETRTIAEMDRRVGELERLVGSSSASLDEVRPPDAAAATLTIPADLSAPAAAAPPHNAAQRAAHLPRPAAAPRLDLAPAQDPAVRPRARQRGAAAPARRTAPAAAAA
ncbi:hypothetical protein C0993_004444 [Termitomyces sp. T159_Od127]|nr:hypothetical protein C0993_004444 [Termitomyces sp. T159_Od127]